MLGFQQNLVLAFVMVLTLSSVTFATYTDGPSNTHYYDDASNAEMNTALISSYEGENQKLDDFRSEVLGFGDDADYYALWMYFWDELLGEKAPDRYVT